MSLLAENTKRWQRAKFKPDYMARARAFAHRAMENKELYIGIAKRIAREYHQTIPWYFIALVHERECRGGTRNLKCSIAQGWPFHEKSLWIPKTGPFSSFEEAAVDALVNQAPRAAANSNWSAGGLFTIGERYNGLGYANKGRPSPYIWAGTDQYQKGKYVADGKYDPEHVDTQVGMAAALKAMMELDPTITLDNEAPGQGETPRTEETIVSGGGIAALWQAFNTMVANNIDTIIAGGFVAFAGAILVYLVYRIYMKKKAQI